jgi:hypothetical protein
MFTLILQMSQLLVHMLAIKRIDCISSCPKSWTRFKSCAVRVIAGMIRHIFQHKKAIGDACAAYRGLLPVKT